MTRQSQAGSYTIIEISPGSVDWAGILAQFTLALADREGRLYATWSGERMARAAEKSHGIIALTPNGKLLGLLLVEFTENAAELSFPWLVHETPALGADLVAAALQVVKEQQRDVRYIRAERQIVPGKAQPNGLEAVGFACHWRQRMAVELAGWHEDCHLAPSYYFSPWNICHLDAAADVVYRANYRTLDARLYAPFFGDSPVECRKGLLAILAGRYGAIHQRATSCVFTEDELVGINLVIDEGIGIASIVEISVDPDHQGHGVGRALMVNSMQVLAGEHFDRVELAVTRENTRAVQLYESLGFDEIGRFPVCVLDDH